MSKLFVNPVLVIFVTVLLGVQACGNKGDLYRESDLSTLEEIEEATEKLKKQRKNPSETVED